MYIESVPNRDSPPAILLREGWRDRRFTMDEINRMARACRVERVMRPYLEALVG